MQLAKEAGFGVHPTGLEHGTVTVSHDGAAFEVTTLRRDVETNGRHAVVAFTTDWAEDAARRDFTINAMYCDAAGKIYDYTDGYADILKREVRFVGRASQRIREDNLRILRFFRFHAWYGRGGMDQAGFKACVRLKAGLKTLSAERVRQELLKLLAAPKAVLTVKLMADSGILKVVLPYTEDWRVMKRLPVDALLRLFVLAGEPEALQERLRLSNAEAKRLQGMAQAPHLSPSLAEAERRRILYHVGSEAWGDAVHLSFARANTKRFDETWQSLLMLPLSWPVPVFPVNGAALLAAGFSAGPKLGQVLAALEDWWVASDFQPSRDDLLSRASRYKD
jgi:poly(A) polymerase